MVSLGGSSFLSGGTLLDGIFAAPASVNGSEQKGTTVQQITDGTSNTAIFSEVIRGNYNGSGDTATDYSTNWTGGTYSGAALTDGRAVAECNNGTGAAIRYVGQEYYRAAIPQTFAYTHTLPINWNKNAGGVAGVQKWGCGNSAFNAAHQPASSYHSGGANVGLADGSIRFITDDMTFPVWHAIGSKAAEDQVTLP